VYFCFPVKQESFQLLSDFLRTGRALTFLVFISFSPQTPFLSPYPAFLILTFLHSQWIRNLNALASLLQNVYLCIGNDRKGSISRMSDECLMKQETVFSLYVVYQAVMRKFTLAGKAYPRWDIGGIYQRYSNDIATIYQRYSYEVANFIGHIPYIYLTTTLVRRTQYGSLRNKRA